MTQLLKPRVASNVKLRAAELRGEGWTYQAIADELGVSSSSVVYWLNPESAERTRAKRQARREANREREREDAAEYRKKRAKWIDKRTAARRRRDHRAFEREQRRQEMASVPKVGAAEAYALVRRALTALDSPRTDNREGHEAARAAMTILHRAEDELVKVVRLGG